MNENELDNLRHISPCLLKRRSIIIYAFRYQIAIIYIVTALQNTIALALQDSMANESIREARMR